MNYDLKTEISGKKKKNKYSSAPTKLKQPEKVSDLEDFELLNKIKKYTTSYYERYCIYIDMAREHMRFLYVDQWDWEVRSNREANDIPTMVFNHVLPNLDGVIGDLKKNSPQLIVESITNNDDKSSIDWRTDLLRQIQCESKADMAYQTALKNQLVCGWGFARVSIHYKDDYTFEQVMRITSDPDYQVPFWDLTATDMHKSEGDFCGVHQRMSKDDYNRMYPDYPNPISATQSYEYFSWGDTDDVIVCDIYYKDYFKETWVQLSDGQEMFLSDAKKLIKQTDEMLENVFDQLSVNEELVTLLQESVSPLEIVQKRDVMNYKIKHIRFVENYILAKTDWPGKLLPIVFFPGDMAMVDGEQIPISWVNELQDAQRLHNYVMSEMARGMLNTTKTRTVGTNAMIQGHEQQWRQPNKVHGILLANPDPRVPGALPQFIDPPAFNGMLLSLQELTNSEMSAISGRFEESRGQESNAISGKAINARISAANNVVNVYFDNNLKGIEQIGRVILDLLPHVYGDEQEVMVQSEDGTQRKITVNKKTGVLKVPRGMKESDIMNQNFEEMIENDVTDKNYNVTVKAVGNLDAQKMQSMELWLKFISINPQAFNLLSDIVASESGVENSKLAAERLKTLLPPDIRAKEEGLPPPTPQENPALKLEQEKIDVYKEEVKTKRMQVEQEGQYKRADLAVKKYKADQELDIAKIKAAAEIENADEQLRIAKVKASADLRRSTAQVHKTLRG